MVLPKSVLLALLVTPKVLAALLSPTSAGPDVNTGITWTGRIFKNDKDVTTLTGDATDILAKILAINPDYDASEIAPDDTTAALLDKRADYRTCAVMATGNLNELIWASDDLKKLGQNCSTPKRDCRRMTCRDTTATYICSELDTSVSIPCRDAGDLVDNILRNCCTGYRSGKAGHIYRDNRVSIWAGYGNCNHAATTRPTYYGYPGGSNNGVCHYMG
ncbi:hypothetical protein QBC36DRAFT_196048 [Triangularia setosa]|uniref:Secreted protein n=1 Tax=Triangularia setosa TaxID=2587417 RepID=A0AAN7A2F5_9PEZI|nr:hypothetical protein QBC36DRAFT_196048 [Podospora setosa]